MNKEDILKRSREENSKGDELEIQKKETAQNNGYFFAETCLFILAVSCDFGITSGTVAIFEKQFILKDVLWLTMFLTSAIEYGSKYLYDELHSSEVIIVDCHFETPRFAQVCAFFFFER